MTDQRERVGKVRKASSETQPPIRSTTQKTYKNDTQEFIKTRCLMYCHIYLGGDGQISAIREGAQQQPLLNKSPNS